MFKHQLFQTKMFNRQTKVIEFFSTSATCNDRLLNMQTSHAPLSLSLSLSVSVSLFLSLSLSLSINVILQHVSDCLIVFGVYAVKE